MNLIMLAAYWPVIGGLLSIVSPLACAAFLLWLKSQFVTKAEHEAFRARMTAEADADRARIDLMKEAQLLLGERVKALEDDCKRPPSRDQLSDRLSGLSERMAGVEKGVASLEKIGGTTNDYLQILIEKGVR